MVQATARRLSVRRLKPTWLKKRTPKGSRSRSCGRSSCGWVRRTTRTGGAPVLPLTKDKSIKMLSWKPWKPERVAWLLVAFVAANLLGVMVVQGYSAALSKDEVKQPTNVLVMLAGTLMYQGV